MKLFTTGVDKTTQAFLKTKGFSVTSGDQDIENPEDLYEWIRYETYDAVVVDLDKTNWGIYLARYLRSKEIVIAVVGITRGNEEDPWSEQRSVFLENGGDDLLRSPASSRELAASLRASIRRSRGVTLDIRHFRNGNALLRLDLSSQIATVNGVVIHLTGKEMRMLMTLASAGDRVQTKEMLLTSLYSAIEDEPEIKIVDIFICRLRKKLAGVDPDAAAIIKTAWGRGYVLSSQQETDSERRVA